MNGTGVAQQPAHHMAHQFAYLASLRDRFIRYGGKRQVNRIRKERHGTMMAAEVRDMECAKNSESPIVIETIRSPPSLL